MASYPCTHIHIHIDQKSWKMLLTHYVEEIVDKIVPDLEADDLCISFINDKRWALGMMNFS